MNFDRIAPYYPWMETFLAGGLMQRCRTKYLSRTTNCRRALLVGEGTGKFLAALLRHNPQIQVTCVEHSEEMIQQIRRRLAAEKLEAARVELVQTNALEWSPPTEQFDLVATHFFLDCFRAEQLQQLVPRLAHSTTPDAIWLLTDFCEPERGWQRWRARIILAMLYMFFRITASLPARRLTPPDSFLAGAGFNLAERRRASFGLTHSDFWQRNLT